MRYKTIVAALAGLALAAGIATAQAGDRYVIDRDHTNIFFLINHLGYSRMLGQFQDFSGTFTFDENDIKSSSVKLTIKTASIDTDLEVRDNDLRSPGFFNVAEFPEMTFVSRKIEMTGARSGKLTGDLTLLGVTKPVTLDVTFNKKAPFPIPGYHKRMTAGFSGKTVIKRSDFGMTAYVPAISDEVEVFIEVEGYIK